MEQQGSLFRDNAEYEAFTEKFKPKRTTDDCYTPPIVYDAVADFAAARYGLDRGRLLRPFWPGADYRRMEYPDGAVVVDNPPFSILSRILADYAERGVRFFLFAPALTLFSSSSSCTALPCGVTITYENGAEVSTSFVTNLEPEDVRVRCIPELYRAVDEANRRALAERKTPPLPKYEYPDFVLTAAMAQRWCKYGVAYTLRRQDSARIGTLDAQRARGKSIFGNGYLLSTRAAAERAAAERAAAERAAAERAAAERAAAERAAAIQWQLSDRETRIVAALDAGTYDPAKDYGAPTREELDGQTEL